MLSERQKMQKRHHAQKRERQFMIVAITASVIAISIPLVMSFFC